ncbi:cytidylate kinase [Globicatella sp. HMSC072A10]|uniref:(d)CMP kinase n=1 Tax=Globicatella sp. HMSC072A10 TaxID=1739315 RepID=UPI0008C8A0FB|nr:(d)CMP kinase [Globicatella sp. HMSC072A10]OFK63746.1 cytidylate kinase [Globicatella sp. HMSC072A10]
MKKLTIAIDGPASSGKSTIAKEVAQRLGIAYVDTGAMYRGITLALIEQKISFDDVDKIVALMKQIKMEFKIIEESQHLFIEGEDVSEKIRSVEITENVSEVAAIPEVRQHLVSLQQRMAEASSVVMDGRDIGTVVLPNAPYKFFFTASPHVRALRRYKENMAKGLTSQSLTEIEAAIIERDRYDSTREHSPLRKADDAILVDTSDLTIDETVEKIIQNVEK